VLDASSERDPPGIKTRRALYSYREIRLVPRIAPPPCPIDRDAATTGVERARVVGDASALRSALAEVGFGVEVAAGSAEVAEAFGYLRNCGRLVVERRGTASSSSASTVPRRRMSTRA
jgi:hypothetical protein